MPFAALAVLALATLAQAGPRVADVFPDRETGPDAAEYATRLRAVGEGPLSASMPAGGRAYRCTVLPASGHPTTVRLVLAGTRGIVIGRELTTAAAPTPGELRDDVTSTLSLDAVRSLASRLDDERLRAMPSGEASGGGRGGSTWIFEVAQPGGHHAIVRRSPELDTGERGTGPLVDACGAMFRAAGFAAPPKR